MASAEQLEGMPECLNRIMHATSVDEDCRGQRVSATENHQAYVDASNMVYALKVEDLDHILKNGTPAGRIYAAVLLRQSSRVGNNLSFDKLLEDKSKVIYKSNDKVVNTTVSDIARSFKDKGAYENFSFSIFCKMITAPDKKTQGAAEKPQP